MLMLILISQHIRLIGELIPVTLALLPLFMLYALATGIARFNKRAVLMHLAFSGVAVSTYVLNRHNGYISAQSFAYFICLLAPFTLKVILPRAVKTRTSKSFWSAYRAVMILTAVLGLGQLLLGEDFVSFRDLIPELWRVEGYNTTNEVSYGSDLYRANGFFFYEPSFFSQFLGLAVLMEMQTRRNPLVVALFIVGIIVSFSGTGIMLLSLGLMIQAFATGLFNARRVVQTLLPLAALGLAAVYVFPTFFLARLEEFAVENSSAYIRFISPALYIYDAFTSSAQSLLLGVGPGGATSVRFADVMADFPGLGKVLYEYGLLGGWLVTLMYLRYSSRAEMAAWLRWPFLLVQFVLNNGLFTPVTLVFFMLFSLVGRAPQKHGRAARSPHVQHCALQDGTAATSNIGVTS